MRKQVELTDGLFDYLLRVGLREDPYLARLREETAQMGGIAMMQIAPEQGAFMQVLVRAIAARRTLEIGVFTGYSALAVALALPEGRVTACDINADYMAIARRHWLAAGVAERIEPRLGPAADSLADLLAAGGRDAYDFAFIDADKPAYDLYYERCLELVRPGGLILIDNALWSGRVADPADHSEDTEAIRALNAKIHDDARVDACLLPLADGIMMCRRR